MRPGTAAICDGTVMHRRSTPAVHEFRSPVSYVWIDPDCPADLCAAHPLWSASRPSPARFRRRDYGLSASGSLDESVRDDLAQVLEQRPAGPVRMLTQIRRWGWLFNPITVYVAWGDATDPVGAILEVTNTPWKERLRYPIRLERSGEWLVGSTEKMLHVSPFLDEDHRYDVRIQADGDRLEFGIAVIPTGATDPVLVTGLTVERTAPTRRALTASLRRRAASTHRVSFGIHWQALRLWLKRVPFVVHPAKRKAVP